MRPAVVLPLTMLLLMICLASCRSGRLDRLDQHVQRMIEYEQDVVLGVDAESDPDRVVATPPDDYGRAVYQKQPGTANPSAAELDVDRAEDQPLEMDQLPVVLDDEAEAIRLDLEGLIGYAIERAPDYRSRKEDLYLATLGLIVERHLWGPRFFNTVSATIDGTPESGDYDTSLDLVNDFTITQRLPYGGSVSASALVDYVTYLRQSSTSTAPDDAQGASLGASIDLPLLRGAGMVARESLIQAERDLVYAVRDFERFRREFFVDIASTYFDLLRRQRQIENQEVQLENLERLAARFEALARAGREPPFEAERASQQVLFGRSNLLNLRESYTASLDAFKLQIGMPVTADLVIEQAEVIVPEPALDPVSSVSKARDYRLDLQTTRDRVEDAVRSVRVAKNRLLPDLDLSADITVPTEGDEDIEGLDFDLGSGSYSAGATLDLPLDRQIERSDYRAALIRLERQQRGYRVERDRVAVQVRRSIRRIRQAKYNLVLQEKNVELAERRAIGVRLRERTLGPRDVIEAQEDLLNARNRRDEAVAELRQSFLQYLLDTGQMRVNAQGRWLAPGELIPAAPEDGDAANDG